MAAFIETRIVLAPQTMPAVGFTSGVGGKISLRRRAASGQ
jgi:hypothetical protein